MRKKADIQIRGVNVHSEKRQKGAGLAPKEVAAMLDKWRRRFAGRKFADSAEMIRQDRGR